jgi:hypothetical protein
MKSDGDTPTISRAFDDGSLVELVYDPAQRTTALALRTPDGTTSVLSHIPLPGGERLVPYAATNNLITSGCVLLPSDIGDFRDVGDLAGAVTGFLHRYVDLTPEFEEIATYYILLSWVYDAFNELGYLRFRGDYGTGKTRALLTVGSLCYKPFFASGASTVSPIFHILDTFGGTLILDEADLRFSDATAELTKILNNGNVRGLPVLRTMTNRHKELNPTAFRVFGPKVIGMRERFADDALESRFLTEETGGRPLRPDVPIHLPQSLVQEATALRNRLLAWRFAARGSVGPKPDRLIAGVPPRLNQTALALLSIIEDAGVRARVASAMVGAETWMREERSRTAEGEVVRALMACLEDGRHAAAIGDVAEHVNGRSGCPDTPLSAKRIGWIVRNRLRLQTAKSGGVYGVSRSEWPKVAAMAQRYGIVRADDAGSLTPSSASVMHDAR